MVNCGPIGPEMHPCCVAYPGHSEDCDVFVPLAETTTEQIRRGIPHAAGWCGLCSLVHLRPMLELADAPRSRA